MSMALERWGSAWRKVAALGLAAGLVAPFSSAAEHSPWHEHAVRVLGGGVDRLIRLDGSEAFPFFDFGAGWEGGVAFTLNSDPTLEWELEGFRRAASGRQGRRSSVDTDHLTRTVRFSLDRLCLFARRRFGAGRGLFVPWVGVGAGVGCVRVRECLVQETPYGPVEGRADDTTSAVVSGEAGLGLDLYFGRTSAWALTVEARHLVAWDQGPFRGDLTGTGVFLGLRWDFWPASD